MSNEKPNTPLTGSRFANLRKRLASLRPFSRLRGLASSLANILVRMGRSVTPLFSGRFQALSQRLKTKLPALKGRVSTLTGGHLETFSKLPFKEKMKLFRDKLKVHALALKAKLAEELKRDKLAKRIQEFDPQKFLETLTKTIQKKDVGFYGPLIAIVLSTYFLADVTALIGEGFIPEPPPARDSRFGGSTGQIRNVADYNAIFVRNLFNSQGLIPGEDLSIGTSNQDLGGTPVKTSLPLNLIGTLIMNNEYLSIGTIEDKAANLVFAVRIEDEIPGKAKITKIEASRVTFVNTASGRREYVELPEELRTNNPKILTSSGGGAGIEKVSATQFNVSRVEVDKALSDFNNILTQARAVPNFENGAPSGYKLFQIVPGSIYDKLGLQNGDVISGLNGQPINDPAKAFEMITELKTASHLELQVKKDGKQSTYTYDIRQ